MCYISVRSVVKTVKEMRLDECLRLYILHPVLKKVILQIMIGEIQFTMNSYTTSSSKNQGQAGLR